MSRVIYEAFVGFYESFQSLNQAAFKTGNVRQLIYYYILDSIVKSSSGAGYVEEPIFIAIIQKNHQVTQKTVKRILEHGEGLFWERKNNRLWKYSIKRVFKALAIKKFTLRKQERPIKELLQKKQAKNIAYLHRAILEQGSCEKQVSSRGTYSKRCHISRQTSIRYTKMTKGRILKRVVRIREIDRTENLSSIVQSLNQENGRGTLLKKIKQKYYLLHQLPNTYKGYDVSPSKRLKKLKDDIRCDQIKAKKAQDQKTPNHKKISHRSAICPLEQPRYIKAKNRHK